MHSRHAGHGGDLESIKEDIMDEEVMKIMENHEIDEDTAERAVELVDELGINEDEAVELAKEGV